MSLPPVPNALLNTMLRKAQLADKVQPRGVALPADAAAATAILDTIGKSTAPDGLPALFREAEQVMIDHDSKACRDMARVFGPAARKQLEMAGRGIAAAKAELAKENPSAQMAEQALHYAGTEVVEANTTLRRGLDAAGMEARKEVPESSAAFTMLSAEPVTAMEKLHGLSRELKHAKLGIGAMLINDNGKTSI